MKRYGSLYESIVSFENLHLAYRKAVRRKMYKESSLEFTFNLEENLLALRHELIDRTYTPGPYRVFTVYEPKARLISAAPFRDRVVHHALCSVIEPIFDRAFIFDSYATRVGKGSHRAVVRFNDFLRRSRFVLKIDVEKYFPSIDHEILKSMIRRKIKCRDTLALIDLIIDCSNPQEERDLHFPGDDLFAPFERRRGVPIGNLTSQFFANVYLDPIDHFAKETLGCRRYIRYMDDICMFSDSKPELREWRKNIGGELERLRLVMKGPKSRVFRCGEGVEFLGFRAFPTHRRLNASTARRAHRRLAGAYRRMRERLEPPAMFRRRFMSWLGHARWGNTKGLVRRVIADIRKNAE